jgi:hypothetical protein
VREVLAHPGPPDAVRGAGDEGQAEAHEVRLTGALPRLGDEGNADEADDDREDPSPGQAL